MKLRAAIILICALATASGAAADIPGKPGEAHWSFAPVTRPSAPAGSSAIDSFIDAKLHKQGLTRNPTATKRELIRRAYFDLIGLPPTPEEVTAFEEDRSPLAFENVIARLLASPHYGERWGRHWLDLVRFAQSNGYERDGEKFLAWRYRDYVIKAFNEDKPYNRFVIEQIAGDELADATAESVIATAFQRLGVFDDEPDDKKMAEFDALDDVLSTTSTTFLGLTIGCARCHEHKTDPISQVEYYSLLAFFRGVRHFEAGQPNFDSAGFTPLAAPEEVHRWRAKKIAEITALNEKTGAASDEQKKQIEAEIKKIKADVPYEWTLAVRENGVECPATHLLARGNAASPRQEVTPAFPKCLGGGEPDCIEPRPGAASSGRRRVLAEWIASANNPLTARVMVNRLWQHHFGEGLVKTTSDFGRAGGRPSHPDLLDWLAAEFVESGWSVKRMHKLIMMSATYQRSSRAENKRALELDPANALLWRQNLRRLEAEVIRDSILAISQSLNPTIGGRGFFPHLAGEVLAGQSRPGLDWDVSSTSEQLRRSVYAFVRRTMGVPLFETFDYNNTTTPLAERPTTTVAPQALMLLNDSFMQQQARAFARRVSSETTGDSTAQVRRAYALALNRPPGDHELKIALGYLARNEQNFAALSSRITFVLDVPEALSAEYFGKLSPAQFLNGPSDRWNYFRGVWAPPYEGIRIVNRDQAPFALWPGANFADGQIAADLLLSKTIETASLLFRARAKDDALLGYELVLNPRARQVSLRKHGDKMETIAQAQALLPIATIFHLKVSLQATRMKVFVGNNSDPILEVDRLIPEPGEIGVRTWGGPLSLQNLSVVEAGSSESIHVLGENPDSPQRTLESFCLLLLNLNEFIYID